MADVKKMISSNKTNYNNSLSFYLSEISKIPLLTRDEEETLALKAKNGDEVAKQKLIKANLRFVVAVAKKYRNQGIPLADLINEGNIGLLTAIDKFDVDKGYHFISYAVWWIRQGILKAICEKSRMIRLPLNRANELIQIERSRKRKENEFNEEVRPEEIAKDLNMDLKLVKHLIDISKQTISLETPIYESNKDSSNLSEFIKDEKYYSPEKLIEKDSLREIINSVLESLSGKEKDIIENRFGLNGTKAMSLKEIGKKYNLTKERIRQIEKKALVRLRHNSRSSKLETFILD
ncbi:MAG: RNA polymerase subunit sigma [Spirochaetes bacterium GWD1_27_9]|nr:MAG: RNA polymerase subunit sigma [Spirochaetes bacterium GWB1_27_13]OHD20303.1 MAG: RNA polymerase subunit sigma [Spirochaetes bacterium GWC1_27_15]OHD32983.1 MAG: RNA polymerase subunit sigma [Spirochaetes bacterium GWD1_27_9]